MLATRLRVYASTRLRVKIKAKGTGVGVFCRGAWMKERRSLLYPGYAATRGYPSKSMLRVRVFGIFSRGTWMKEGGSL